jgi:glycosidase
MSQLGEEEARAFVAATWLLTSPGVPFIYYGEEIGMIGTKPDEDIRRPLQWSSDSYRAGFTEGRPWRAPASDYRERSVALQEEDAASLLNHYRALIHLRNEYESLRTGDWLPVETGSIHLYAYLRYTEGEIILVLINLDDEAVSDYTLSLESGPLTGEITGSPQTLYGDQEFPPPTLNENGGLANYQPLPTIPPYSSYLIQLLP